MKHTEIPKFELRLETETGEPLDQPANQPYENFGNIAVKLQDGRRYAKRIQKAIGCPWESLLD